MYETVTVDQATSRGRRMISYPLIVILPVAAGASIFLSAQDIIPGSFLFIGIPAAFVLAWLYWSFMITKWRIWAFDNVRNVHELKKKAIEAQLIWSDGSFWEKTEIRSWDDKEKLRSLESKFDKDDVYNDDYSVPDQTIIYYSKSKSLLQLVFSVGMIGLGIYLCDADAGYIAGIGLCGFGAYLGYKELRNATNKNPQIILNKKGIQTISTPFYEWKDISSEEVIKEYYNKNTNYYLQYNCPEGGVKLQINEYDIDQRGLENLLHVYRVRSNTKPGH